VGQPEYRITGGAALNGPLWVLTNRNLTRRAALFLDQFPLTFKLVSVSFDPITHQPLTLHLRIHAKTNQLEKRLTVAY